MIPFLRFSQVASFSLGCCSSPCKESRSPHKWKELKSQNAANISKAQGFHLFLSPFECELARLMVNDQDTVLGWCWLCVSLKQ